VTACRPSLGWHIRLRGFAVPSENRPCLGPAAAKSRKHSKSPDEATPTRTPFNYSAGAGCRGALWTPRATNQTKGASVGVACCRVVPVAGSLGARGHGQRLHVTPPKHEAPPPRLAHPLLHSS